MAFIFEVVKGTATASTRRLREGSSDTGDFLPRRFCSASTAATNRSNSRSSSCLSALGRSLGRMCRRVEADSAALSVDGARFG